MAKKTNEEYIAELAIKNPNVEVIGKYVNAKTKILHRCKIHNIEWEINPDNALHGGNCSECAKENRIKNNRMSHEEYVKRLSIKNPKLKVVEEYIDAKTKILHHCLTHDIIWKVTPDKVLSRGSGCPECAKKLRYVARAKTHKQYVKDVENKNPSIEVIGKYINNKTAIEHRCKIHDYIYNATPDTVLSGSGCRYCKSDKLREHSLKSEAQYISELADINPHIILIGNYTYSLEPTLHKCLKCNHIWNPTPARLLYGGGCPNCSKSSGEQKIESWLENNNINYIFQKRFDDCRDIQTLPFDFYLPDYKCCIEYDGAQHYKPVDFYGGQEYFEYVQKHDSIKNKYCEDNGISLLRIPFDKNIVEELNNFLFI